MRFWVLVIGFAALAACGPSKPPLAATRDSAAAMAQAILDAVAAGDRAALAGLALSEQEFHDRVWPELPAARPERNLPFSYVWGDLHQKSEESLSALLAAHAGRRYTLMDVRFGDRTPYQTYTVHRAATFLVRDAGGQELDLRLCGSMIEQDGRWKVFSYVVND
ncbi:MAG: hypothetical protein IT177_11795 [Acidobacteria bacterium]|nr:hypothetical protein [Acidobacteriota bacterium]